MSQSEALNTTSNGGQNMPVNMQNFPMAKRGQNQLASTLASTKDPKEAILQFQEEHSLHSYLAKALFKIPIHEAKKHVSEEMQEIGDHEIEHLQPESVLTFLHHLNVPRYQVHKSIMESLRNNIEDEIQKMDLSNSGGSSSSGSNKMMLLELLKSAWAFRNVPELRAVFISLVKKLDEDTPVELLQFLAEKRVSDNQLKHGAIVDALGEKMKRLVWEADWEKYVRGDGVVLVDASSQQYDEKIGSLYANNILMDQFRPEVLKYLNDNDLIQNANLAFSGSIREKKVDTNMRRAATAISYGREGMNVGLSSGKLAGLTGNTSSRTNKDTHMPHQPSENATGSAVTSLKQIIGFRPKLLNALLNVLIVEHGKGVGTDNHQHHSKVIAGSEYLPCTLLADVLLSHGQLPRQFEDVYLLAKSLDKCVRDGMVSDNDIAQIQLHIKSIFQTDQEIVGTVEGSSRNNTEPSSVTSITLNQSSDVEKDWEKKLLRKLIKGAVKEMKESDTQGLFLSPVTDEIAAGYSKIIKKPICIRDIEEKATNQSYSSLSQYESDVLLMYSNCMKYNIGDAGLWYRNEARRQEKKWRDEILKQVQNLYNEETTKRRLRRDSKHEDKKREILLAQQKFVSGDKRNLASINVQSKVQPLATISLKKRKKDIGSISMPVLASMLLSDPFFARILLDKLYRGIKNIVKDQSLPLIHETTPSVLQLLHIASFSKAMCATKGKRFSVPDVGLICPTDDDIPTSKDGFIVLRQQLPILGKLLLEMEFDKRLSHGGDLEVLSTPLISHDLNPPRSSFRIVLDVAESALVHVLQPGMSNTNALQLQCKRLFVAIRRLSESEMSDETPFFVSLNAALLRYKAKLNHSIRDMIITEWIDWIRVNKNRKAAMVGSIHYSLVHLLREWSSLGNLILPRDTMLSFLKDIVSAADFDTNEQESFSKYWMMEENDSFRKVKNEYMKILRQDKTHSLLESLGIAYSGI